MFNVREARKVAESEIMFGDSACFLRDACYRVEALEAQLKAAEEALFCFHINGHDIILGATGQTFAERYETWRKLTEGKR